MDIGQEVRESTLFLGEMVSRNSWSHTHQQIDWRTHNFFYFLLMDTVGPGLWANRRLAQLDLYPPESDGIDAERALHVLHGLLLRFYLFLCLLFHLPTLSKQASTGISLSCAPVFLCLWKARSQPTYPGKADSSQRLSSCVFS